MPKAKQELEQDNKKTEEEGKKSQKITKVQIYKKACSLVKGQHIQCGNRLKDKRDKIQIFFGNLLKSNFKHDDSFLISSMQKYNVRKVILTSLGIIKYRSQILKNKEV